MTDSTDNIHRHYTSATTEPTLGDVLRSVWNARLYIAGFAVLGFVIAFLWLGAAVPQYRATMLIAPAERSRGADLKSLMPQSTSFAIQKLVNSIAPQDTTDFVRFTHILRGPAVAEKLLEGKSQLKPVQTHRRFMFSGHDDHLKNVAKMTAYLDDNIAVHPVGNTALRRVVYDHSDPEFAKDFLAALYYSADSIIREDNRIATDQRIEYLRDTLEDIRNPDHRRAITSLLMEQEHSKMILAMDEPFAAMMAERPSVTHKPHWPNGLLVYGICILLAGFAGYAVYAFRQSKDNANSS